MLFQEDSDEEEGVSVDHLLGSRLCAAAKDRIDYNSSVVNIFDDRYASPVHEIVVSNSKESSRALPSSD